MAPARQQPTVSGRFEFQTPSLFHARVRLYPDRLELTGWQWRGRYRRCIDLDRILQVDVQGKSGLLVWLLSGETLRLRLPRPALWKQAIEAHMVIEKTPT